MMTIATLVATAIYRHLGLLKSGPARWVLALGFTILVTVLLVQSSSQPLVGPAAPPGPPDVEREIVLTLGHVAVFSVLVVVWWWAVAAILPLHRALFVAVGFSLLYGVITEVAQTLVQDRQASFYDLAVNWTVTMFVYSQCRSYLDRRQRRTLLSSIERPYGARTRTLYSPSSALSSSASRRSGGD